MMNSGNCNLARLALARICRRFVRQQDGVAAVEFAFVATPFLALCFAILQTALVFFAGQVLETAASDSARLILTGQAQSANLTQAQFKQEVCKRVYGLFDCEGGIQMDVRVHSAFSPIDLSKPIDADGKFSLTPVYEMGDPGDIVVLRLFYQWPIYTSLLGSNLTDLGNNKHLLIATAAFRNEPYRK